MCDPDMGWKYGFPKAVPEDVDVESGGLEYWLVKEGYPERLVRQWQKSTFGGVPCRFWEVHDE